MTFHQKFVDDMQVAGIITEQYFGRFYWKGPAARSDQQNGPTLQDIIDGTKVPLQWDSLNSNYIVYPIGQANAEWKHDVSNSDDDGDEADGYCAGYVTTFPKEEDEDD